jgi:hypothetical protein
MVPPPSGGESAKTTEATAFNYDGQKRNFQSVEVVLNLTTMSETMYPKLFLFADDASNAPNWNFHAVSVHTVHTYST